MPSLSRASDFFRSLTHAYILLLIRFRYLVVLLSLGSCALLSVEIKDLHIESDYKYFYEKHDPALLALNYFEDTFGKLDTTFFAIQPEQGSIDSPDIIRLVHRMTEALWAQPYVARVDSITNYQYTRADGDTLLISDLLEDPEHLDAAGAKKIIAIASASPELNKQLISLENNALGIVARTGADLTDNALLEEIALFNERLRQEIERDYPGVHIAITGMLQRGYHFYKVPQLDMRLLIPLMFGLLIAIIWLLTSSISCSIIIISIVGLSAAAAMGLGAMLGLPVNTVSAAAPVIILTVAVADSIHIITGFLMHRIKGLSAHDAVLKSMLLNAQPVLLTTATTAIGFLSLNFSVSPPYKDLGNFAAFGTGIAWLLSMSFLPAILCIVPIKGSTRMMQQERGIGTLSKWIIRSHKPLFSLTLVTTLIAGYFLPRLEFNDDFATYFASDYRDTQDIFFMMDKLTGIYQINMTLYGDGPESIYHPDYLHHVERYTRWLESQPEITHVRSVVTTFKKLNRSMHGDDASYYRIADDRELNAQYLLLYELSLPYGLSVNDQITPDKSATRLDVSTVMMKTRDYANLAARMDQWMKDNLPAYMYSPPTSSTLLHSQIGVKNYEAMKLGTAVAFLGISLFIAISLNSVSLGIVSLILNVIPFVIGFGFFAMSGNFLALWAPFVVPTALGLVVDATVHLLSKYHFARNTEGLPTPDSIHYAFTHVGMALWVSTLVLVLGFSTLYFAITTMLQFLGVGTALILLLALLVDVMALPALLLTADRVRRSKAG